MTEKEGVSPQITDGVTQASVTTLANTPSYALAQSNLAFAQSQGVLFANMISEQQQQSSSGMAAIVKCVHELLDEDQGGECLSAATAVHVHEEDGPDYAEDLDESFVGDVTKF